MAKEQLMRKLDGEGGVQEEDRERYAFLDFNGRQCYCRLRIRWIKGGAALIWVTELSDNPGMSVTNASEKIATKVVHEYGLHPHECLFVEHYPGERGFEFPSWSVVNYDWQQFPSGIWKAKNPQWDHLKDEEAEQLVKRFVGGARG